MASALHYNKYSWVAIIIIVFPHRMVENRCTVHLLHVIETYSITMQYFNNWAQGELKDIFSRQ